MKKHRLFSCVIAAAIAATSVALLGGNWTSAVVEAAEAGDSFTYEDFECTYLEDGTIEISDYNGSDTEVVIPTEIDGIMVTLIGDMAFYNCDNLTSIKIPSGVTSIGSWAFGDCYSLTNVKISEGMTEIKSSAFSGCHSLTSIEMPSSVMSIGSWAFSVCSSLTSIEIPSGVMSIGSWAFDSCSSLTSVTISEGVTEIGYGAFWHCKSLTSVTLPESLTTIDKDAFYDCANLKSIIIPESVTYIDDYAFGYYFSYDSYSDVKVDDLIIYGYTGTAAENYANENGFTFIALNDVTLGDVDQSGAIDYFDAMAVLQYDAELIELTEVQLLAGDVNHDGSVDSFDAVKILQYDAELIESFK